MSTRRKTIHEFIARATQVHGDRFDYTKTVYKNSQSLVTIICRTCGTEFQHLANNHVTGTGCKKCSLALGGIKRQAKKAATVLTRFRVAHGDAYDYSLFEYRGSKTPGTIICRSCGNQFQQSPDNHYAGKGCTPCATLRRAAIRTKTHEQFVAEAEALYGTGVFDYSETSYVYAHEPVRIRCCACDFVFMRSPASHLQRHDCPNCSERRQVSKAESAWLDSLGIPERQYRVKLPGRKTLLVDGYDPKTNTIYAFLGSFWHADPRKMPPEEIHPIIGLLNQEIHEKTLEQLRSFEQAGYSVVAVWEDDVK